MILLPKTLADFEEHVLRKYPEEACGFVVNDAFIAVPNTAKDKKTNFRISPTQYVKASRLGSIQAVLHSHPYDKFARNKWPPEWPSTADMTSWMNGTVPWGIVATCGEGISQPVWLDESKVPDLIGREFIHGIHDCYSMVRDWFKINRGITLLNFPRGMEWWYAGKNLYDENFEKAGFVEIDRSQIRIGDVILMKAASQVTNHAAIVVGENQILHHMFNRLSGTDTLSKWNRCVVRAIRYKGTEC